MPSNIPSSPPSVAPPPGTPPHQADAPASTASGIAQMAVDYQQIEAEEKVVVRHIDQLAELKQELRQLSQKLAGNLSTYSRDEVVRMSERAHLIEQQLETLQNPEKARTDQTGTDAPGL